MKKIIALGLFAFAAIFFVSPVQAQRKPGEQKEKKVIIIEKKSGEPENVITIDSISSLVINGDKMNAEDIISIYTRPDIITGQGIYGYRERNLTPRLIRGLKIENSNPGAFARTFLGVTTKENKEGAEVMDVTSESPAAKAGIQKGDIITKVGDKKISNPQELSDVIKSYQPGNKVDITILRGKKAMKLKAELSKWNDVASFFIDSLNLHNYRDLPGKDNFKFDFSSPDIFVRGFSKSPSIGLQVQDTEDESGVSVLKVEQNSAAEKAGVKVGDMITSINDKAVKGVDDVLSEMRSSDNKNNYSLKITRDGKPLTIDVKIPKKLKKAEF